MLEKDFYSLVKRMRTLQKEYFRKRKAAEPCQDILQASKAVEKEIDAAIIDHEQKDVPKQGGLF